MKVLDAHNSNIAGTSADSHTENALSESRTSENPVERRSEAAKPATRISASTDQQDPNTTGEGAPRFGVLRRLRLARLLSVLGVLAFAMIAAVVAGNITSKAASTRLADGVVTSKPVQVGATPIRMLEAPRLMSAYRGIVIPRREADLAFRRSGRIAAIHVDAGDTAEKGATLGVLDTADLEAELSVAQSEFEVAKAQYEEALAGPRNQTIRAAEARIAQLNAQTSAARKRLVRQENLRRSNATSQEALEEERFTVSRLEASIDEAGSQLDELLEGTRSEQLKAAKSRVRMAEAAVELVGVQLADSKLIAPFDCVVGERFMDEGAIGSQSSAALSIIEQPPLEAQFGLPSDVARTLRLGENVEISIGMHATRSGPSTLNGKVTRMQPRVDAVTRTREVVVRFDVDDVSFVGEPATLWLPWQHDVTESLSGRINVWVPSECLVRNVRGLWGIYILQPDEKQPQEGSIAGEVVLSDAKVLRTAGDRTLVALNASTAEILITEGVQRIGPGVRVLARSSTEALSVDATPIAGGQER